MLVDWIEEMLSGMAAKEKDDEEQEDVLALTETAAAAASPHGNGREAGEAGAEMNVEAVPAGTGDGRSGGPADAESVSAEIGNGGRMDAESAPVEIGSGRSGGRTAAEIELEQPGAIAGETAEDENGETVETLWKEGPVWTVRSVEPGIEAARRLAAERTERAAEAGGGDAAEAGWVTTGAWAGVEWAAVRGPGPGTAFEGTRWDPGKQAGLEGLYRQAVQAVRPAAPALPPEQAGRTARAQEPGSAASLAVDELDRAVRRDSRRYDGGMSIF